METSEHLAIRTICGGINAVLTDATNHYFGGYFHVRILVSADIPIVRGYFDDDCGYGAAISSLGDSIRYSRTLEAMAVPESMIDSVRKDLIVSFDSNVLPYLRRDDFISGFIGSELRRLSGSASCRR